NEGSATAVIYKIELTGGLQLAATGNPITTAGVTPANSISVSGTTITVSPGAEGTIGWNLVTGAGATTPIAGTRYQVSIYTRAGNVISATVQAR
ncbi:MAG: hypothetical protein RMI45_08735, partial [Ignisphaera sp.]|nr:hypothetical protein [Ignisphaera sp.]